MKVLITTAVLLFASSSFAGDCSKDEAELLAQTRGSRKIGQRTGTDVAAAELNLLQAQLHCAEISTEKYCTAAPAVTDTQLAGVKEEARVGQRTVRDVVEAQRDRRQVRSLCNLH